MEVRFVSLTNETDVADGPPYEWLQSFRDFNGSHGRRVADPGALTTVLGQLALAVLLSSFVVVALAGNLLVIVAVMTDRNLRRTGNYFIVSLALADALVAAAVMTFAIANDVTGGSNDVTGRWWFGVRTCDDVTANDVTGGSNDVTGRWWFGTRTCRIWMSADVMCSTASILNLCAISLDRYVHVRSPLHYDRLVTHRRSLAAIALVWIMSALISFLPIHVGWHRVNGAAMATAAAAATTAANSTTPSHNYRSVYTLSAFYGIYAFHCVLSAYPKRLALSFRLQYFDQLCICRTTCCYNKLYNKSTTNRSNGVRR